VSIYLDHAATTPMSPVAIKALTAAMAKTGNASSLHTQGRSVRKDVEEAREAIALASGARPNEIIFTGSGTEANNLAVKGFYWSAIAQNPQRNVIVIAAFEHHAILEPVEWLEKHEGAVLIYIPITPSGVVDLDALATIISSEAGKIALVSVMHSNNELGTVQPIAEVVKLAGDIPVHVDAVQSFGKVGFNFEELGATSATISAHKIGGPLGVAALILRRGLDITPILHGGGQERDIRSGTINAPAIVAFAAAATDVIAERDANYKKVSALRALLKDRIADAIPDAQFNGDAPQMLPGVLNVTFPGTESDSLLLLLDAEGICSSTGSACSAGVQRPSHVLMAIGLSEDQARSSLRFSLGLTNTEAEINEVGEKIAGVVARAQAALVRSS
jgi:cysteine desulfurase